MSPEVLAGLQNLSIGVVAILALVYIAKQFLDHLKKRDKDHDEQLDKREMAMRDLEKEVRQSVTRQLIENSRIMERVLTRLEK